MKSESGVQSARRECRGNPVSVEAGQTQANSKRGGRECRCRLCFQRGCHGCCRRRGLATGGVAAAGAGAVATAKVNRGAHESLPGALPLVLGRDGEAAQLDSPAPHRGAGVLLVGGERGGTVLRKERGGHVLVITVVVLAESHTAHHLFAAIKTRLHGNPKQAERRRLYCVSFSIIVVLVVSVVVVAAVAATATIETHTHVIGAWGGGGVGVCAVPFVVKREGVREVFLHRIFPESPHGRELFCGGSVRGPHELDRPRHGLRRKQFNYDVAVATADTASAAAAACIVAAAAAAARTLVVG
mmetsp:Transcript_76345/g.153308  ORF Transcript_76345/g.153308 Transcript_76345/m.153308 type:complete len:300 (+) Transcript_76345:491-1390(+)